MGQWDNTESVQALLNRSYNPTYQLNENLIYGYSSSDTKTYAIAVDTDGKIKISGSLSLDNATLENIGIYDAFEQGTLSATDVSGNKTLAQQVETADICNTGSNEAFINFDGAATTSHYQLRPGESLSVPLKFTALHAICSAGETTTLRIIGYY